MRKAIIRIIEVFIFTSIGQGILIWLETSFGIVPKRWVAVMLDSVRIDAIGYILVGIIGLIGMVLWEKYSPFKKAKSIASHNQSNDIITQEEPIVRASKYVVADGKSITSLIGTLGPGKSLFPKYLVSGSTKTFDELITKGFIVPKQESEIKFGNPLNHATESNLKWFHIPISIDRDSFTDNKSFKYCKVWLIFNDEGGPYGDKLEMNYQSDIPSGTSEFSLDINTEPKKIPIAFRKAQSTLFDNEAYFSDKQYLEQNEGNRLIPNLYEFRLKVVSSNKEWLSPTYALNVPDYKEDNSTFTMVKKDNT